MAQLLKAMTVLLKDLGSIPGPFMVAHNCLQVQFQGIQSPLWASMNTRHIVSIFADKQILILKYVSEILSPEDKILNIQKSVLRLVR